MPPSDLQLSDLQLALLRVLWDRTEATVVEVQAALGGEAAKLAPTTVATLLGRLEKRGLVTHTSRGRTFVYRASVPEHDVRRTMLAKLTEFFFAGDPNALVSHLTGNDRLAPEEIEHARRLVASARESDDSGSS
jgi:predicted transcriptional regulator